jgi:hypothetical protein
MGSTPAARHAGSADASNAASLNANVAEASMTGSQVLTLNNCCVIGLPAPIAAGMPIANPMATWEKVFLGRCGTGDADVIRRQRTYCCA